MKNTIQKTLHSHMAGGAFFCAIYSESSNNSERQIKQFCAPIL